MKITRWFTKGGKIRHGHHKYKLWAHRPGGEWKRTAGGMQFLFHSEEGEFYELTLSDDDVKALLAAALER